MNAMRRMAHMAPAVPSTRATRLAFDSDAQSVWSCLSIARGFSFMSIGPGLDIHLPKVVERIDELRPHVCDQLELDVGLLRCDHRAVNVVARTGGERAGDAAGLLRAKVGGGDGVCQDVGKGERAGPVRLDRFADRFVGTERRGVEKLTDGG